MVPISSQKSLSPFLVFCVIVSLFIGPSLFLLPEAPNSVSANGIPILNPGYGTATIDGNIDAIEWASADTLSLSMSSALTTTLTGTLYVMQDADNLYLGFAVDDDELTTGYKYGLYSDALSYQFDDNNSGELFEIGENKVTIFAADPWYGDGHFYNETGSSRDDTAVGGTTDGTSMASRQGENNHFELCFPLCSGDEYDFCLHPDDTLGLRALYYDMYPVDGDFDYAVYLFPGSSTTSLVQIQFADWWYDYDVFFPFILK